MLPQTQGRESLYEGYAKYLEDRYVRNVFGEKILHPSDQELVIRVEGKEKVPRKVKKARGKVRKANPQLVNDPLFKYEATIPGNSNSPEVLRGKESRFGAYISYVYHRNHAKKGIITPNEQKRMPKFHVTPGALVLLAHDEQGNEYFAVGERQNGSPTLIGGALDPEKDIAESPANGSKNKGSKDTKFLSIAKSVQREAREEVGVVVPSNLKPKAILDLRFGRQLVYMHDTGMTKDQFEEAFRSRSDDELAGITFVEATPEGIKDFEQQKPKGLGAIPNILRHMVVQRKIDRIRSLEPDKGITKYNPAIYASNNRKFSDAPATKYQLNMPYSYQESINKSNRAINDAISREDDVREEGDR